MRSSVRTATGNVDTGIAMQARVPERRRAGRNIGLGGGDASLEACGVSAGVPPSDRAAQQI